MRPVTESALHRLCVCLLLLSAGALMAAESPEVTVNHLHKGLQTLDDRLPLQDRAERRKATRQLLATTHDLDYMARFTLGRHWRQLSDAQRIEFRSAFRALSVSRYADNFTDIQRVQFKLNGTQSLPRERAQVKVQLVLTDDAPVALDYTLQPTPDGDWRIIQVRVEGVSDLALKRSQYSALLEQQGFDALVAYIYAQAVVSEP